MLLELGSSYNAPEFFELIIWSPGIFRFLFGIWILEATSSYQMGIGGGGADNASYEELGFVCLYKCVGTG